MKYTITAVIPTVQYGNIQPSIEVEADSFEQANAQVMPHIQSLWNIYGDKPLIARLNDRQLLKGFVGGEIYFDPLTHTYTNEVGDVYESGSKYAKKFEEPFDAQMISNLMAKNLGKTPEEIEKHQNNILAMWELKSQVSKNFGHSIHGALELYGKYLALSQALDAHRATRKQEAKFTHLHSHPILKEAVESFYRNRENEIAEYEALVIDHKNKRVGRIDRLLVLSNKRCRIQDYKTDADVTQDRLKVYWEQLKFYGEIMEANGWVAEGLDIFSWKGEWKQYKYLKKEET